MTRFFFFFLMIRRPPRSTLFPYRRSSDLIGILAAIAIPIYSNMQARARVAKAQSDLRGMYSALVAFGAHCGDVPASQGAVATWKMGSFHLLTSGTSLSRIPASPWSQVTDN